MIVMMNEKEFDEVKELTRGDKKTITQRILKNLEELGELSQAVLANEKASGCAYKKLTVEDMMEEAVDNYLCAVSIIFQIAEENDIDSQDVKKLMETKIAKWTTKVENS